VVTQEVVECLPFIRKVNTLADGYHLVVVQLGGNDWTSQSLLFLAPNAQRLGFSHPLSEGRLQIRDVQTRFMRRIGTMTSFIFFAAPARAELISSNVGHGIASGIYRSVKNIFVQ
jgi:hypothetical protein